MLKKKMFLLIGVITIITTSCSEEDKCSCTEIKEKGSTGKYQRIGLKKDGDFIKFGDLFNGECEIKDGYDNVLEKRIYNNGQLLETEKFKLINDKLIQTAKLKYSFGAGMAANFKMQPMPVIESGYYKYYDYDKNSKINYTTEYKEFENKEVKYHWKISVYEMVTKCFASIHIFHDDFNETNSNIYNEKVKCELSYFPQGDDLIKLLTFAQHQNLPEFWSDGELKEIVVNTEINSSNSVDEESSNIIQENVETIENSNDLELVYYTINDPDGYSNLRETPNGEIIQKVYQEELFEVIGEENEWKKVQLASGKAGYIHSSRIVLNQ